MLKSMNLDDLTNIRLFLVIKNYWRHWRIVADDLKVLSFLFVLFTNVLLTKMLRETRKLLCCIFFCLICKKAQSKSRFCSGKIYIEISVMDKCSVGSYLKEECNSSSYGPSKIEDIACYSIDDIQLIKKRIKFGSLKTLCRYHFMKFTRKFHHIFGAVCSDPFKIHKKKLEKIFVK